MSYNTTELQILNSICGLNPTGQMILKNGVFEQIGNPSVIMTKDEYQMKTLEESNKNVVTGTTTVEDRVEKFENMNNKVDTKNILSLIFLIIIIVLIIYLIFNIKKKYKYKR